MATDFLIVGGGIGGLVLAELLTRGGKKAVVLERSIGPPAWNRPEVLWPATARLLFDLQPQVEWERQSLLALRGMEIFDGQQIRWGIAPETLDRAGVRPWSTNPNQTRELLMRTGSFELHRGVEVREVLKEKDRIIGVRAKETASGSEREWLGQQTVGDDGGKSLVRSACGIELKTRMLPVDFLCFQCDWPAEFRPDAGRILPNLKRLKSGVLAVGVLPAAGGKGVGLVLVRPRIFDDLPPAQAAWEELVQSEPAMAALVGSRKFPDDFQRVRRPWGHAPRYGAPGALLMGDAAHPVSPAGGQGANMSIADGRAIAELALADERDLLCAYERRRRPPNRRSVRITRVVAHILGLPEWLFTWVFFGGARWLGRNPSLMSRIIRTFSTTFLEP